MKILQLCNKIPYPPFDGGAIAILHMAESFAENGHQVTVLAMNTKKHNQSVDKIPLEIRNKINFIYIDVDTRIRLLKFFINLIFSDKPYNASRFNDRRFSETLSSLLQKESFDIVQLEGLYLKPYMECIRNYHPGILSYRAHNIESDIWHKMAHTNRNPVKRFYFTLLARRLSKYEKDMINRYDILVPITQEDLIGLKKLGNTKPCHLAPTGIPDRNFKDVRKLTATEDLFYIGALDWIPNQEAILWFTDHVWMPIMKSRPGLRFHVAGRNAPVWLSRKFKNSGVEFHGEVPDAYKFMDAHCLMVVPLFAGSGLRIKIIEAMARSKPVITTRTGAQGLHVVPGKELILAETAGEWIQAIDNLIGNLTRLNELQKNAYLFVRENYSNDTIVKKLLYFYKQHIAP